MYSKHSSQRPSQNKDFQYKLLFFIVISIISFLVLIIKIGTLQIIKNISYSVISKENREKVIRVPPIRGKIYSADNQLLAHNITSFNIYLSIDELYEETDLRQEELVYISEFLQIEYADIENLIKLKAHENDILLAENISLHTFSMLKENLDNLPGISYKEDLYREYPNKDTLSHVLGYTGPINANEFAIKQSKGYLNTDIIGKNGIEKYYEKYLRGEAGKKVFSIDARMIIQEEIPEKEIKAKPGNELVLTIDLEFQKNVEDILADRTGTVLVIKPDNGEILAMASYPDYDPNIYVVKSEWNEEKKRFISLDTKGTPLINRNIQSLYPPASIYKIITSSAILQEDIVPTTETFYCGGIYRLNNEYFKCWVHPAGHARQDLNDAVKNSCDIYFYNTGLKVGPEKIQQYALSFGFGNTLGIDIPFEKQGIIPAPETMEEEGKHWHAGHTLITTIGQGDVKVTPLQVANFMSILSNKGISYKPHLLKEIHSSFDGSVVKKINKEKIIDVTCYDQYMYNFLDNTLRNVVTEGTALQGFYTNPLQVAGKTGTAEIGTQAVKQTHSWFAGFGPLDYPPEERIVVVVLIEYENGSYYRYAAPIASMVFYSWFNKTGFHETAKKLYYPIRNTYLGDEEEQE